MQSGGVFEFGPYRLDVRSRQLRCSGAPVAMSVRQFDLLQALVAASGAVVAKNTLIDVAWQGVAVGDSSLEKLILQVRQTLDPGDPHRYIKTVHRVGYQLVGPVTRIAPARADVDVYARLAPHRAWIEGRAALESLIAERVFAARTTFEELVAHQPDDPLVHVGLATACVLQFETTRADLEPRVEALPVAAAHAHEACRLNPNLAEAWATLGFVLERTGDRMDALAALQRAVSLEPDNWLHWFRQAAGNWGRARVHAARSTLAEYPGFPLARLLVATVKVARGAFDAAEGELNAAVATIAADRRPSAFSPVAIHWLRGLLCLARGTDDVAMAAFDDELAAEPRGHLYAKECCASTWYAIGTRHLRRGDAGRARAAFTEAIARVPRHAMAHAAMAILDGDADRLAARLPSAEGSVLTVDAAMAQAACLVAQRNAPAAARVVDQALIVAPPGNAGWLVPLDPLLDVRRAPDAWAPVLQRLRDRAA
jgi:DNA-binding winged helix-turn-helix (wHTH) protein